MMVDETLNSFINSSKSKINSYLKGFNSEYINSIKSLANKICLYDNALEAYIIYEDDLKQYLKNDDQINRFEKVVEQLCILEFENRLGYWMFDTNVAGSMFCKLNSLIA